MPESEFSTRDRALPADKAIVSGLSGRYAIALFELAQDSTALDDMTADLDRLDDLLDESAIRQMITSPVLSRAEQGQLVACLAGELDLGKTVTAFLGVLAQNRRLPILRAVIRDIRRLMESHRGETRAEVVSAKTLDSEQMQALQARLKDMTGRDVVIQARVDESLIGGLVVRMGSRMIDGSLATRLDGLERAMKGV